MHHRTTYVDIDFQPNRVNRSSVKTMNTNFFAKNRKLHIFATTNSILKKMISSGMPHHKTYMYINFQQNWVSRSVKTVQINVFAKNRKLQKLPTTTTNFEKINYFRHASSYSVHGYQFSSKSGY